MVASGDFHIGHLPAACFFEGFDHVPGAACGNNGVDAAVPGEDGHVDQFGRLFDIGSAADGEGGGKEIGVPADGIPGAVSAHGNTADIETFSVGIGAGGFKFQHGKGAGEISGDLRERMAQGIPRRVDPLTVFGALGEEKECFLVVSFAP